MGMTNAERQKRHRERVKERLRVGSGDDGSDALKALLIGSYHAAGLKLLEGQPATQECAEAFLSAPVTVLDLMEMVEAAGQRAALAIYEREVREGL